MACNRPTLLMLFFLAALLCVQTSALMANTGDQSACQAKIEQFMKAQCGGACSTEDWQDTAASACTQQFSSSDLLMACCPEQQPTQ